MRQLRLPHVGLRFHSDRGSQYARGLFRAVLEAHGIEPSMSRTGNCDDHAVADRFFATLRRELVGGEGFTDWRIICQQQPGT